MAKAMTSVMEVMVIETPACFIMVAILFSSGSFRSSSVSITQASQITNISSTPIPTYNRHNV